MKIVFLLHSQLDCNSGYHADIFASKLSDLGHEILVIHAGAEADPEGLNYRAATHDAFLENPVATLGRFRPDAVLAWTPREIVRRLWEELVHVAGPDISKLVIHFEDNEAFLTEQCQPEIAALGSNLRFFDPRKGGAFVDRADGFTFVTASLQNILPMEGRPYFVLPAPYDDRLFRPVPRNDSWRRERGISDETLVIVYTGNVHRLNRPEVQMLYDAVERLSRSQGILLVRTGTGMPIEDTGVSILDLGVVPRSDMPDILAAADIFVQPGRPGPFDNYRFPSKIPEMAITGRPVICPNLPCLSTFADREEVFKCELEDPDAIGDAVTKVISTPGLSEKLSDGSVRAALRECDPARTATALADFLAGLVGTIG